MFPLFLDFRDQLWDVIIRLCLCKGRTHYVKVLESKSGDKIADTFDLQQHVTVQRPTKSNISDEIYYQYLCEWCQKWHRKSGQWSIRISLNDNHHAAFIHVSHCITLRTDLMYVVEIFGIAYGTSWKLRRRSCISKGEEVEWYLQKSGEIFYMP